MPSATGHGGTFGMGTGGPLSRSNRLEIQTLTH